MSVVVYGGVVAWSCSLATNVLALTLVLGGLGGLQLLAVLVRKHEELLGPAILFAGCGYVLGLLVGRHPLDEAAPLVGAGLLLSAELATWSVDERLPVVPDRGVRAARAGALAALVVAGLAAASLVIATAATSVGGGIGWTLVGAAAAVLAVGVAARAALRT